MSSESQEEASITVTVSAGVDEWLDDRAEALDVEREELLRQLVGAYQVAAGLDGDESAVEELDQALSPDLEAAVEDALSDQRVDISATVAEQVDDRLDEFEREMESQLEEVRRRVVQLKNELDDAAPEDHHHQEFERLDDIETGIEALEDAVSDLEEDVQTALQAADSDVEERLDDAEDKLTRVATAVVRLRRSVGTADETEDELDE